MDIKRNYIILDVSELDKIIFDEILNSSIETLRYSLDGTKTFIKWDGNQPSFVDTLDTKSQVYSYDEIITILETSEWKAEYNPIAG
jgi:hypothetical protein